MTTKADLESPDDVAAFVRGFYADVAQDDPLGPMFNNVARVDWATHVPKIAAFWTRALFGVEGYTGNPYAAHAQIHAKRRFTADHFYRWLELFSNNLDADWSGPNADKMMTLAHNVARVHSHQLIGESIDLQMDPLAIRRVD